VVSGTAGFALVAVFLWCSVMPCLIHRANRFAPAKFTLNESALVSFLFLVAIAVSKTILTKHIFEHIGAPVAMSALSCIVTGLMLVPICLANGTLRLLTMEETKTLSLVCLTVAADLAFTNVGLAILPIAFQQAIKSTLPVVTIAIEFLLYRKCISKALFAVVVGICLGPITMALDKDWTSDDDLLYGVIMLSLSIVAGAFKYVLAHSAMARFKEDMGVVGFTFWMEVFATIFILPWSIANGEASLLLEHASSWVMLIGTAAFGGVRILAQFFLLEKTSPTTLATLNIVIQVGLTAAGALVFHDPITVSLVVGTLITIVMSASYTYVKSLKSLHRQLEAEGAESLRSLSEGAVEDEESTIELREKEFPSRTKNANIIGDE
jgi:drug/metabolite transporter (DMT)-like permease